MNKLTFEEQKILTRICKLLEKAGMSFDDRFALALLIGDAKILYRQQGTFTICIMGIPLRGNLYPCVGASKRSPKDPTLPEIGKALSFRRAVEHYVELRFGIKLEVDRG